MLEFIVFTQEKNIKKNWNFCFEPSGLNLGILSKNIVLNKLENEISICQLGLTNEKKKFLKMHDADEEGGALSNFGNNTDFDGKKFNFKNKYKILEPV